MTLNLSQIITKADSNDLLLSVNDLHHRYNEGQDNEVHVLKGIDFDVPFGEMVAIMGPSGCGKTTLLNVLGGLDKFSSGDLEVDGHAIKELTDNQLTNFRRDNIGYIFQLFNLFEDQTAVQNVVIPLLLQSQDPQDATQLAKMMLLDVGLGARHEELPGKLSGGEQQKVAIARALVTDPKLILADEPTGDLDQATSKDIMALFRRLQSEKPSTSIVIVTHSRSIAEMCDRIIRIEDGKIASDVYVDMETEE